VIYFDLDGVLRDIHKVVDWIPKYWEEPIDGCHIVEFFGKRPYLLMNAPATEYLLPVMHSFAGQFNIMTACPDSWLQPTLVWISKHLVGHLNSITFTGYLEKLHLLKKGDILIEDCPRYNDYSQIILIAKSYNADLELPHTRVSTPSQLLHEIERRLLA
jgi:hypothetical protein